MENLFILVFDIIYVNIKILVNFFGLKFILKFM